MSPSDSQADQTTATVSVQERRDMIVDLISLHRLASQADVVSALASRGVNVAQATVSRDLDYLGITKLRGADGALCYVVPTRADLPQRLRQFSRWIDASHNLAVIRTEPGAASAIAYSLDNTGLPEVLATIQGDDAVLVIAREPATGADIAQVLTELKDGVGVGLGSDGEPAGEATKDADDVAKGDGEEKISTTTGEPDE